MQFFSGLNLGIFIEKWCDYGAQVVPKFIEEWIHQLSGRVKSSRTRFFSTLSEPCLRVAKKNRHSDLDLTVIEPTCMIDPKHAKCSFNMSMALWSSCHFEKMKKLSLT